jgi:glycine hydroxymethyltransferase
MGSHHKSLPGPQGGLYFTRSEEIYKKVRQGLYPTLVTNHHVERAPALAATYLEMLEFGEAYATQIGRNSSALGRALYDRGLKALYPEKGFSQSHQVIVDVSGFGSGGEVARLLEEANIICGATAVPGDLATEGKTSSGLRFGTQELTRIGMVEGDMEQVAELVRRRVVDKEPAQRVAADVVDFVGNFKTLKYCFDENADPYEALWKHL